MLKTIAFTTMVATLTSPVFAKQMTEKEKLRAEAEHVCFQDAQKFCSDTVPDETKTAACMRAKRASLSPACGKVMDRGTCM